MKPRRSQAQTPMAFVRTMLLGYRKHGVSPGKALAAAGISARQLRREDARIDAEQMETFAATAMRELDDEALGWFSRRLPWGTYGMLCRASLGAQTLRMALTRWCRHHALLTEDIRLQFDGGTLLIEERSSLAGPMREFCLLTSFRYLHGYACWLVDSQLPLGRVTFPFAAPRHRAVYPLLFPGPVTFDAEHASLTFDARYLDLPPRRDEAALDRMLENALPLTVRPYRRDRFLVARVNGYLADPATRTSTASAVARALHVSVRSLHRHLSAEGASLQRLKDVVHRRRALELLLRTDLPIKQLARRVGFENEKSFARAFRTWTGTTPSRYRSEASSAESPEVSSVK